MTATDRISSRRTVLAWCFYDWANSGYTTLLITVVVIFIQRIVFVETPVIAATVWAWSIAVSMLVGALLSPLVGAIADAYSGKRIGLGLSAVGGGCCCNQLSRFPVPIAVHGYTQVQ